VYDLEDELLRAAHQLCDGRAVDSFTCAELRELIVAEAPRFPRLASPRLVHLVEPLAERLVIDGFFGRSAEGYVLTEQAHARILTSPRYL
jgi:hypothetical protein